MRDSFVFYRSFVKSAKKLPPEQRLALYEAIIDYALDETEPGDDDIVVAAIMEAIVPQIDANNQRYENGKKGGRPKKPLVSDEKTIGFENKNHRFSDEKPNVNVNANENVNENVDVDSYVNATANALGSSRSGGGFDEEFNIWKMLGGEGIDAVYDTYPNTGGLLLDKVYEEIKTKKKKVNSPLAFVMGYAKKVGWSDEAQV